MKLAPRDSAMIGLLHNQQLRRQVIKNVSLLTSVVRVPHQLGRVPTRVNAVQPFGHGTGAIVGVVETHRPTVQYVYLALLGGAGTVDVIIEG
jgi:hypothetical protein